MSSVLEVVYSLPFAVGLLCGILGQRAYCYGRAWYKDRNDPLPNGRHRTVAGISKVWVGGLIAVGSLGYVLYQAEAARLDTVSLAEHTQECTSDLIASVSRGRQISTENDRLSIAHRDKLTELAQVQSVWLGRILDPPPHIAAMPADDPRRDGYFKTITQFYKVRTDELRADIDKIREEQAKLIGDRERNPLPDPRCWPDGPEVK
ncbi:hypothetical protein SEA_HAMISH_17 [Mycobacterium phage Hamish]|uniref:Uncharacterized protein n=4 Tax=Pegunavirus TaxID=1623295 RepID=A0A088FNL2_9CAUD|nr:hypothetical protein NUMBERTEN_17 [Mycobacterium phage Numberten]AIM49755.1 hypothetical protein PBI_LASSO_17 [Mycobacterium phage Lasso]AVO24869.1 hypothetical protein SEA_DOESNTMATTER_17 [Mycobacterium phage DoesntMatter]AXQ63768.1 hypothetical protein SEA_GOPHEE_17 [Mycobacterium phage Gophee]AXQ64826.1 hypothetical protein SEA_PODRICK_17 [Mycobacterium phage Podrick]AYD86388.1 hypothetical protein SEA_HAMISH_17 [Mycobacterium phage Hamish]AZS07765.1 hypothetical protein SEA_FRINGE_17 [